MLQTWDGGKMNSESWTLVPNERIGELIFGTERKEIHRILGKQRGVFRKSCFSKNTTDDYTDYHVYYSKKDTMEAVEIFSGIEVSLNGRRLFPGTIEQAKTILTDLEYDSGSYISRTNSVGLYAPNDKGIIEAVLVACKSYYKGTTE